MTDQSYFCIRQSEKTNVWALNTMLGIKKYIEDVQMKNTNFIVRYFTAIIFMFHFLCTNYSIINAQNNSNTITFDNQSGEFATVKLMGPTSKTVEVLNEHKLTVNILSGTYYILARYGTKSEEYKYSKGESFAVTETATQYSDIFITLHKVIGGNYLTHSIEGEEFYKAKTGDEKTATQNAQTKPKTEIAIVKMMDGGEVKVTNIKLLERGFNGNWLPPIPSTIKDSLYYTIFKSGVEFHRAIPFSKIQSINLQNKPEWPYVIKFTILLRDSVKIVSDFLKRSVTIIQPNGKYESYKGQPSVEFAIVSGDDKYYGGEGFIGQGILNGESGTWQAEFHDIQKINFLK